MIVMSCNCGGLSVTYTVEDIVTVKAAFDAHGKTCPLKKAPVAPTTQTRMRLDSRPPTTEAL